jgi:hypothetical protein
MPGFDSAELSSQEPSKSKGLAGFRPRFLPQPAGVARIQKICETVCDTVRGKGFGTALFRCIGRWYGALAKVNQGLPCRS